LPEVKAPILSKRFVHTTLGYFLNPKNVFVGDTFFAISPKRKTDTLRIATFLNSTAGSFLTEVYGRTVMGEGVLLVYGPEIVPMPILNPELISDERTKLMKDLLANDIGPIFDELGASSSEEVSLDKVKPDRRKLDRIIMGEILGLTDEEQLEVYRAVVDLVKSRIEKAKSFGKRGKTKGGIDTDAFVKIVMGNIGGETLGRFYKEKILTQEPLLTKVLPKASGDARIEQDLFGWRLFLGKESVECESEAQARYLKVFLEVGFDKVQVPQDKGYLGRIVSELEELKTGIDEVINSYLESIVNARTRRRLEQQVWSEIMKGTA